MEALLLCALLACPVPPFNQSIALDPKILSIGNGLRLPSHTFPVRSLFQGYTIGTRRFNSCF